MGNRLHMIGVRLIKTTFCKYFFLKLTCNYHEADYFINYDEKRHSRGLWVTAFIIFGKTNLNFKKKQFYNGTCNNLEANCFITFALHIRQES